MCTRRLQYNHYPLIRERVSDVTTIIAHLLPWTWRDDIQREFAVSPSKEIDISCTQMSTVTLPLYVHFCLGLLHLIYPFSTSTAMMMFSHRFFLLLSVAAVLAAAQEAPTAKFPWMMNPQVRAERRESSTESSLSQAFPHTLLLTFLL